MADLEAQLAENEKERAEILRQIDERNRHRTIPCMGCDARHEIGDLTAIQTHGYISPSSCNEGAYWVETHLQFICPDTNVRNRLLFFGIPWGKQGTAEDPYNQFNRTYKKLFKEVLDSHDDSEIERGPWENNFYPDEHREEYGLSPKEGPDYKLTDANPALHLVTE